MDKNRYEKIRPKGAWSLHYEYGINLYMYDDVCAREVILKPGFESQTSLLAIRSTSWCCCFLFVPHLARLSRLCRGWSWSCWHRVPAGPTVFASSLLFFDPTPQVLPPHCHSCNIRVKILSAVYCTSVFSVLTHERVVVWPNPPRWVSAPQNLKDEVHLLGTTPSRCSWCFHEFPWRFQRIFFVRAVYQRIYIWLPCGAFSTFSYEHVPARMNTSCAGLFFFEVANRDFFAFKFPFLTHSVCIEMSLKPLSSYISCLPRKESSRESSRLFSEWVWLISERNSDQFSASRLSQLR